MCDKWERGGKTIPYTRVGPIQIIHDTPREGEGRQSVANTFLLCEALFLCFIQNLKFCLTSKDVFFHPWAIGCVWVPLVLYLVHWKAINSTISVPEFEKVWMKLSSRVLKFWNAEKTYWLTTFARFYLTSSKMSHFLHFLWNLSLNFYFSIFSSSGNLINTSSD
jgi:hypothetical protein